MWTVEFRDREREENTCYKAWLYEEEEEDVVIEEQRKSSSSPFLPFGYLSFLLAFKLSAFPTAFLSMGSSLDLETAIVCIALLSPYLIHFQKE